MKIAEISLLYKSKVMDSLANYRPISLLTTMSKLLDKIVYKRVYSFLEKKTQYYITNNTDSERAIHAN